jgi:threonine aldolase
MNAIHKLIDLRSDTVTLPTKEMKRAMHNAELGDAGRQEDPTMRKLETVAAEIVNKDAAIFVPSGTMSNLVALMSHTHHGDEFILDSEAHNYYHEAGGFAAVAGLSPRFVATRYGVIDPNDIEATIRPANPNYPTPRLLLIENTHNRRGGNAVTPSEMQATADVARSHGLVIHLDGARVFNAAIALKVPVTEITRIVDSVSFCFSKGLSAPVGSMLAGDAEFIARAKRIRKLLGGDMRQSGVLAAAALVALETMIDRLAEDHQTAAELAARLEKIPGVQLDQPPHPTNMVYMDTKELHITAAEFVMRLAEYKVLCLAYSAYRVRFVTHRHINLNDVKQAALAVETIVTGLKQTNT